MKFRIRKTLLWSMSIAFVFTLTSCATIFGGQRNTIKVAMGSPNHAQVYLDGVLIGEAPFAIRIEKQQIQEGSLIEVKKEGYQTLEYEVVRRPHVGYVLLDIIGGVLPLVVDVVDGNIYRPNTRNIEYQLIPLKKEAKIQQENTKAPKN